MNNKIFKYLFIMKSKYILLNVFFILVLVLMINLIEISRIIEAENSTMFSIFYLSILKIPSIINTIIPFAIILSTAFIYKNIISNNEFISMRNIGYSILDIFKPIASAIFIFGILIMLIANPLAAKFENLFDSNWSRTKDFTT